MRDAAEIFKYHLCKINKPSIPYYDDYMIPSIETKLFDLNLLDLKLPDL